jgi:hypothetical protein
MRYKWHNTTILPLTCGHTALRHCTSLQVQFVSDVSSKGFAFQVLHNAFVIHRCAYSVCNRWLG